MAPPPPGAGGAADGPEAWYKSLPIITRCWFTACVLSTVKFLPYRLSFACDQTMYRVSRRALRPLCHRVFQLAAQSSIAAVLIG